MNFDRLQPLLCRLGFHRRGRLRIPAPEYQRARCRGCKLNMIQKPGERWRLATIADHLPPPKVEPVVAPKPPLEPFTWPKREDDASPPKAKKPRARSAAKKAPRPAAAKKPPAPAAAKKPPAPAAAQKPPAPAAEKKPRRAAKQEVTGAEKPPRQRKPRAPKTVSPE